MEGSFSDYFKNIGLNRNLISLTKEIGKQYFLAENNKPSDNNKLKLENGENCLDIVEPSFDTNLNYKLNSRTTKIHGVPIDRVVSEKLYKLWAYLLRQDLPSDFKDLLELFEIPDKLQNDSDYFRFITAVNIISSCTVSIRFTGILQLFLNTGITFGLKWLGKQFSSQFL